MLRTLWNIIKDERGGVLEWVFIAATMIGLGYWGYQRYVKAPAYNTFSGTGSYMNSGYTGN